MAPDPEQCCWQFYNNFDGLSFVHFQDILGYTTPNLLSGCLYYGKKSSTNPS
jgi:hypothetical protein